VRVAWVSDRARTVWEPRIARAAEAWSAITWRSVAAGVRRCALDLVEPEDLVDLISRVAGAGLVAVPIAMHGRSSLPYAAAVPPFARGTPFRYRVVIGAPGDAADMKAAWDRADADAIGALLGYPACCRAFFQRVWVEQQCIDTTWAMACHADDGSRRAVVDGPPEANVLLRWAAIRAVPHLPCRFDCEPSTELGRRLLEVGTAADLATEVGWIREMLAWPAEWSGLHGIAEIKTPVLKISTTTDATAEKLVVQRRGARLPDEAARGTRFPFAEVPPRATGSRGHRRGLDEPIRSLQRRPAWYYEDNGFSSEFAMRDAHRPILELAASVIEPGAAVLDLGCGNGALVAAIARTRGAVPYGIDLDPNKIEHARALHAAHAAHFAVADLFGLDALAPDRRYDVALLMPGRVAEVGPERAAALVAKLRTRVDRLILYAYGDWLVPFADLAGLAERAGFDVAGARGPAALATIRG
jgi:hypothetical protein